MTVNSPLQTFGLAFQPPEPFCSILSDRFPAVSFVVPPDSGDREWLQKVDALFAWGLSEDDVHAAPALRWVQWVGAGVERAPLQLLADRGIVLTNNRGVHAPNIAEHLMSLMLAFTRQLPVLLDAQSRQIWTDNRDWGKIGELQDSELLILGAGQIGSALAERARAFGMRVSMVGREARDLPTHVHGTEALDSLLSEADHVAICLPLTPTTERLFDAERLARMKPGAFLYNIGRGQIVDTEALVAALQSGHLGGAGLDVTDPEPLPSEHPLWTLPNVIITAHTAGITPRYWQRALNILIENIERFRRGEPLRNEVRIELGY